ncbi:hypothetical protein PG997_014047 [Apiospora hydei]|uniref:Uncharacterized protein n=1 Tax=Apiospora hydei TaxID=1337664 RepID=A0ABR1V7X7_9PEZI
MASSVDHLYRWPVVFSSKVSNSRFSGSQDILSVYSDETSLDIIEIFADSSPFANDSFKSEQFLRFCGPDARKSEHLKHLDCKTVNVLLLSEVATLGPNPYPSGVALTARGLFQTLHQQVSAAADLHVSFDADPKRQRVQRQLSESTSCEDTRVFVTNLSRYALLALAATAPWEAIAPLRDAIYRHLMMESHFIIDVAADTIPRFSLEFHLPMYTIRRSEALSADPRGLRKYLNISFLFQDDLSIDGSSRNEQYLLEAQTSCMIVGQHNTSWKAYMFADTYFDDEDPESAVEVWFPPAIGGSGYCDARLYWVLLLKHQANLVEGEWHHTVNTLIGFSRKYVRSQDASRALS